MILFLPVINLENDVAFNDDSKNYQSLIICLFYFIVAVCLFKAENGFLAERVQ